MRRFILLVAMCLMVSGVVAAYGNYTSFTYNITSGMGTQTTYPVKFILSNASGISGYYSGDNVIFTNGTTRPDWFDINATDGTGSPTPFWVATTSQTTKNVTAWVNVPSIDVANTSTGRWYYGDAAQSSSTMTGLNTFPTLFDDFDGAALNTTQWTGTGTTTVGSGYLSLPSNSAANRVTTVKGNFSVYNISWESYAYIPAAAATGTVQFRIDNDTDSYRGHWFDGYNNVTKGIMPLNIGTSGTTYGVNTATNATNSYYMIKRNGGSTPNAVYSYGATGTSSQTLSTNYYIANTSNAAILNGVSTGSALLVYWTFIRKSVPTEPTTSVYLVTNTASLTLSAGFSQAPNPSSTGQAVTYTDTSTGSPTTWNWTLAGTIPTNATQNAAYTYSAAGTYNIFLNVTNSTGSWSNTSQTHTVTNVSGFNPQDIWMEGQYLQTFHTTDSATGLPIPVVDLQDTAMQTYTTTNGTGYLTEPFGASTVVFVSSGYISKSVSYVFDSDESHSVQMTPSSPAVDPIYNTVPPEDVKFHIQSFWGAPIQNANVSILGITTSTGNWDWLVTLFGIPLDSVAINGTEMVATTDTNGDAVFLMLKSVKYNISVTASGYTFPQTIIAPQASHYTISANMNTSWFPSGNNTLEEVNVSVSWVRNSSTDAFINITYVDNTGTTTGGDILVYREVTGRAANLTPIVIMNITAPSCSNSTLVQTPVGGADYRAVVNATTSGENIIRTFTHSFKGAPVTLPGWTTQTLLWLAMFIIVFTAMFAGATHAPQMGIVICVESWVFWGIGWFNYLIDWNGYAEGALLVLLTAVTFLTIIWSITEGKAKGKRSS